jgi:autotransporter-associated beta strand protein
MKNIVIISCLVITQFLFAQPNVFWRTDGPSDGKWLWGSTCNQNGSDGQWFNASESGFRQAPDCFVHSYVYFDGNGINTMELNARNFGARKVIFTANVTQPRTLNSPDNHKLYLSSEATIDNFSSAMHTFNATIELESVSSNGLINASSANININNLILSSFSIHLIGGTGRTITINGSISGSGQVRVNGSGLTIVYNGQSTYTGNTIVELGTLQLNHSLGNTIPATNDLIVQNGGVLLVSKNQTIDDLTINAGGKVIIESGVNLVVNGNLINQAGVDGIEIKSNNINTASLIHQSSGVEATVERYIPLGRRWRILAAPHIGTTNQTIGNQWQTPNNTGVLMWNTTGAGGFVQGPQNSVYRYQAGWQAVTSNTETLFDANINKPLLVFSTGPHGSDYVAHTSGSIPTKIITKGTLFSGNYTHTINPNQFSMLANPYSSAIDTESLMAANPDAMLWLLDPSINVLGGYVTFDGSNWALPEPIGNDKNIQLGQGFFVRSTTTSFLIEANKRIGGSSNTWFARQGQLSNQDNKLRVLLYKQIDNQWQMIDGVLAVSQANANSEVNDQDAPKLSNFNENLMFRNGNTNLAIEYRAYPTVNETQNLRLTATQLIDYQLKLYVEQYEHELIPYLEDSFTNTLTVIPIDGSTLIYPFQGVESSSTNPDNRFRIVYQDSSLSTDPFEPSSEIELYPNPAKNSFSISKTANLIEIYNLTGQLVKSYKNIEINQSIAIESLQTGIYSVKITDNNNNISTQKLIKN